MKEVLKRHYLPAFFLVLPLVVIPSSISLFNNYNPNEVAPFVIMLFFVTIFFTFIIGLISYKYGDRLKNKNSKILLKKKVFQEFIFKNKFSNNQTFIEGNYKGYHIIIFPVKDHPQQWVEIQIVFNPKQKNSFIPGYVFERLNQINRKEYTWNSNMLTIKKYKRLHFPNYEKIKTAIDSAVQLLIESNIEAITIKKWNELIEETQKHYHQVSSLNI
ncbi:hypothetical protein ACSIGC_05070 [Tenacibaculum sp. ZS6-P6]|uniref:hypothetical protein n=1 Tax=Tenacibaculum sp. ZS6-P6 TaxID=3447503 RepID=UPI003F95643D